MFNVTDALSRRISKTQKESVQTNRMQRASANLPEKTVEPVSPETTASTRIPSPGLEHVKGDDDTLKEATSPEPASKETEYLGNPPGLDSHGLAQENRGRNKRRKWPWIIAGLVIVVVLAIALGVGLGVGLKNNGSKSGNSKAAHLSAVGAFNGSGIALASQSFENGGFGSIVLYFQHHSGQIRSAQLSTAGKWQGGDATDVVAVDAKNGTPIAAVAYSRGDTCCCTMTVKQSRYKLKLILPQWHIFYINTNGSISEVTNSNETNVWVPGPLNKLNLKPMDDPNVGFPVPGQSSNDSSSDSSVGIFLWYGSNPTTFQSSAWSYGSDDWTQQQDFKDYNGHAGVGCYSWGPGTVTYTFFVDLQDNLVILWKDSNASHKSTADHPVIAWTKSNVSIPVFQNTSLGFTNNLYYQNPDLTFSGVNVTWDAEKTIAPLEDPAQSFVINGQKGLPGSRLSVTSLPDKSGGNSLLAFYQTNGSDITEFVRDFDAGQWTSSQVPIANTDWRSDPFGVQTDDFPIQIL